MSEPTVTETISTSPRAALAGIGTALCFSLSGVFVRLGLESMDAPLVGVVWGVFLCLLAYGVLVWRRGFSAEKIASLRTGFYLQLLAAILVAVSTWLRYIALGLTEVAVVVALGRVNVPLVIFLAPLLVGQQFEQVTWRVWFGAGLVVVGSVILTFA